MSEKPTAGTRPPLRKSATRLAHRSPTRVRYAFHVLASLALSNLFFSKWKRVAVKENIVRLGASISFETRVYSTWINSSRS